MKDLNQDWHNILHVKCAMRLRAFYKNVDFLTVSVKVITIKNRTIVSLFSGICVPPAVIITRWSSLLRADIYYEDNLPEIK